jgi:putative transposase
MRNILEKARKRDYDELKAGAQPIYLAGSAREARELFRRFRKRWSEDYPAMVKQLEKDLPELLNFFCFPRHLWRKLRTTNIIERVFVEVRRRTRPMVCFVNVASVDRIIYSIFHRFNLEWRNRTLRVLHKRLDMTCDTTHHLTKCAATIIFVRVQKFLPVT